MAHAPPPGQRQCELSLFGWDEATESASGFRRSGESAADIDEVVADDAESDPAFHAVLSFVTTAIESMASLYEADPALASGSPFLAITEPALFLQLLALVALGRAVRNRQALHSQGVRCGFVLGGKECRIGGGQ